MPDPKLPDWGPYSKKYFGISHIADHAGGVRFDCFVMPQLLRRKRELPDALSPCGLIPEYAAPDLSAWQCSWRLDDNVSAVIKFQQLTGENGAGIECILENKSDHPADAALHWFAQLAFEHPQTVHADNVLALLTPELPPGRGVEYDSRLPRETADNSATDNSAFMFHAGETVNFAIPAEFAAARRFIRFRPANAIWQVQELSGSSFIAETDILVDALAISDTEPEFVTVTADALPQVIHADARRLDFVYPG